MSGDRLKVGDVIELTEEELELVLRHRAARAAGEAGGVSADLSDKAALELKRRERTLRAGDRSRLRLVSVPSDVRAAEDTIVRAGMVGAEASPYAVAQMGDAEIVYGIGDDGGKALPKVVRDMDEAHVERLYAEGLIDSAARAAAYRWRWAFRTKYDCQSIRISSFERTLIGGGSGLWAVENETDAVKIIEMAEESLRPVHHRVLIAVMHEGNSLTLAGGKIYGEKNKSEAVCRALILKDLEEACVRLADAMR